MRQVKQTNKKKIIIIKKKKKDLIPFWVSELEDFASSKHHIMDIITLHYTPYWSYNPHKA